MHIFLDFQKSINPALVQGQVPIFLHYLKLNFKLILSISVKNHQIDFSVFQKLASLQSVLVYIGTTIKLFAQQEKIPFQHLTVMPKQKDVTVDTQVQVLSLQYKNMLPSSVTVRCDHLITLYGNVHKNLHVVDKTISCIIKEQPGWSFSRNAQSLM